MSPSTTEVRAVRASLADGEASLVVTPAQIGAIVDGEPSDAHLVRLDDVRARIVAGGGDGEPAGRPVAVLLLRGSATTGRARAVEVVVHGWRFEVEVEAARRAELRERATRAGAGAVTDGRLELRAVIPGRVLSVAVNPGDQVAAGDRLLVIEAMKMQNELRAPRAGTVAQVAVGAGETIELRDLLLVLE
jgi:biotin carboxyl carrier protein